MVFYRYMPRSGIAGLYGNSIFSFLMNLRTVLQSGCMGSLFSTLSPALITYIDFFMMATLIRGNWVLF